MNIVDFAKQRYATKAFDSSKKLTEEHIEQIKQLLRLSPSSTNIQPWHFILASTDKGKAKIAESCVEEFSSNFQKVTDASHVLVFCTQTQCNKAHLQTILDKEYEDGRFECDLSRDMFNTGRTFFVDMHKYERKDILHWMEKQIYLNLGNLLLGVATLGIDAVPIEGFKASILDKKFHLREKGLTSVILVALGYRSDADFNAPLPKSRLDESALFTFC